MRGDRIRNLKKRLRDAERSQRELEKRIFHLKTLHDVSREIGFLAGTQAIIDNLLLMVIGTFGAERGLIVLRNVRENRIETLTHRGWDETAACDLVRATEAGSLAQLQVWEESIVLNEREGCQTLSSMNVRVWIPFAVNEHLKGGIGLGEKLTGEAYTTDDSELLVTLANQAAAAIQNAQAHEDLLRYAEDLAASLRRIQILESMKANLAKFVPKTVQDLIEESPEAPLLEKREADLSVLFADITGYTRLSAQMEMHRVNQLVEVYFGAFLDEILKYGGDVNETAGDGLMVIFRDPDPQRHATSAVLAAFGILRRTLETNATLEGYFEPIAMHVGINSGIASVGATKIEGSAGTRWTYTASGPTTNIAARLAALGEGGSIVISEETKRRLGDAFQAEDMGCPPLKNLVQPIRAYRLSARESTAALMFEERRRHPRRVVSWPVRIWIGDDSFDGRAVDASIHGLCLATGAMDMLKVGASYRVEIFIGGNDRFPCTAEVKRFSARGAGMETKEPCPLD